MSNQSVLIIGLVWPEPDSSAAGARMLQLIKLFTESGSGVTFASAAMDSDHMSNLEAIGVRRERIALNDPSFDDFIKKTQPDTVLFDRFMTEEQYGWRVAKHCPKALRLLDTEDLHCLRQARQAAVKENREFHTDDLFSDIAKREIASILRCDLALMISEYEMQLLQDFFRVDTALLHYLPFLLEPLKENIIEKWPAFDQRNDFVFIGNFLHEPNWDAVRHLSKTIWPLIREKKRDAVLKVYGAYPSQKVLQLHQPKEGFHIMGRAADALAVIRNARVVLAPIRFGAGIKGKLVEAMYCGTPSVTTCVGAEAMEIGGLWNGAVADRQEDFAEAALRLYLDEPFWKKSCENGVEIFNARYLKSIHAPIFLDRIRMISENLERHRRNNFIGAMLLHHTMASTQYMSRWIEAKNKSEA